MSWLIGLLGLGGIGATIAAFIFPNAPLVLAALKLIDKVPAKVVYAVAGVALLAAAWLWHGHAVKIAYRDGKTAGEKVADDKWAAATAAAHVEADQWRQKYEIAAADAVAQIKANHDETVRADRSIADDLRMRGPGKAALSCTRQVNLAGVSSGAGRPDQPAPNPDAPRREVPSDGGYAVVPWPWLVDRAREHDDLIAKVTAYRERDAKVKQLYDDAVAQLAAPK